MDAARATAKAAAVKVVMTGSEAVEVPVIRGG